MEPTMELYIKHLCDVFDEVKRVLRKTGSCWVVMGDTYGGSCQGWGKAGKSRGRNSIDRRPIDILCTGRPPSYSAAAKSLCLIPSRFAIEMTNRGWVLRNIVVWWKPNCMPSSAKDRFTVDYELVFFFVKSRNYYFEQQFEPVQTTTIERFKCRSSSGMQKMEYGDSKISRINPAIEKPGRKERIIERGRNKRCVWPVTLQPFSGAHFAVYPESLIEAPIKAGCPENGVVLDPFVGSGTTCVVAGKLGRKWIGIDVSGKYCEMARKRIALIVKE